MGTGLRARLASRTIRFLLVLLLAANLVAFGPSQQSRISSEALQKAGSLEPEPAPCVDATLRLAEALGREGRFEEAASAFAEVLRLDPANARARQGRTATLLLAERYADAFSHLEESLAVLPDDLVLQHTLARVLATCPDPAVRDGERALVLAHEVLRKEPSYEHVETVAMAFAELGRFDEAVDWQRRLLEQVERSGRVALEPRVRKRLEAYERREPCRAPWLEGFQR